jgi:hypothetical protein
LRYGVPDPHASRLVFEYFAQARAPYTAFWNINISGFYRIKTISIGHMPFKDMTVSPLWVSGILFENDGIFTGEKAIIARHSLIRGPVRRNLAGAAQGRS